MLKRKNIGLPLCFIAMLHPSIGLGQLAPDTNMVEREFMNFTEQGPPSPGIASAPQVIVEAGQADGKGELSIKTKEGLGVSLSAPLNKDTELAEFTSLDGLANNLNLAVSWQGILSGLGPSIPIADIATRQEKVCAQYQVPKKDCVDEATLQDILEKRRLPLSVVRRAVLDFNRVAFNDNLVWGLSFETKLGYKKFDYFLSDAKEESDAKVSDSISAALLSIYGPGRLSLRLTFQQSYEDNDTVAQRCQAIEGTTNLEDCKGLPLGEPQKNDSAVVRLDLRHIFGGWAISPLASWDFEQDVLGLEVPIYFLLGSQEQFTGGLRIGWRSDEDEPKASIFISKPIPLF